MLLIDTFGWSWEYVDEEMTLPRMEAIAKHWETVPPLSVSLASIAAALGVKRSDKKETGQDMGELIGALGGIAEKPAWLKTTQ